MLKAIWLKELKSFSKPVTNPLIHAYVREVLLSSQFIMGRRQALPNLIVVFQSAAVAALLLTKDFQHIEASVSNHIAATQLELVIEITHGGSTISDTCLNWLVNRRKWIWLDVYAMLKICQKHMLPPVRSHSNVHYHCMLAYWQKCYTCNTASSITPLFHLHLFVVPNTEHEVTFTTFFWCQKNKDRIVYQHLTGQICLMRPRPPPKLHLGETDWFCPTGSALVHSTNHSSFTIRTQNCKSRANWRFQKSYILCKTIRKMMLFVFNYLKTNR